MRHKAVIQNKNSRGYTLTEMMIVVALMAIVIGLAAPSLTNFIENNRMTTVANRLVSAILLARNEAISRRSTVIIRGGDDGWVVKDGDDKLASYRLEQGVRMRISNGVSFITFTPDGYRDLSAGPAAFTFTLCSEDTVNTRIVNVSAAGTTSVEKGTEGCPTDE